MVALQLVCEDMMSSETNGLFIKLKVHFSWSMLSMHFVLREIERAAISLIPKLEIYSLLQFH